MILEKTMRFEVAERDAPIKLNWDEAVEYCKTLPGGWRLPSKDELDFMFENKDKIGGFAANYYWSSSEGNSDSGYAWGQGFYIGHQGSYYKDTNACVRPVRDLEETSNDN